MLKQILEIGQELTDAPDTYIMASAYWALSSTLGKYVVIPYYPSPPDNPVRPSVWFVIAGLPGIMRKSTVIESIGKNLVRGAWREYYKITAANLTPDQIEEQIAKMFIETGSYEGIIKHLVENQKTIDSFFLVSTEWGGVLQTMRSREYMVGFSSLLSKLWSGEEHVVRLARETRYIRKGLYVTALLGMQEPWLYLDNYVFRQGLMRRIILVYAEPKDKTRWLPPLSLKRMQLLDQLSEIAEALANKMVTFAEYYPIEARFTADAHEKINKFAYQVEEEIIRTETAGNWSLYAQNLWDHVARLSVLHAIDRVEKPREAPVGAVIMVELRDVENAIRYIQSITPKAREAISMTSVPIRRQTVKVATEAEETIKAIIHKYACNCVSASKLLSDSKMLKDDLKKLVLNLIEKDEVKAYSLKTRGRPKIMFCVKEHAPCFIQHSPAATELSVEALKSMW